jgi:hypothetical protein
VQCVKKYRNKKIILAIGGTCVSRKSIEKIEFLQQRESIADKEYNCVSGQLVIDLKKLLQLIETTT